MAIILDTDMESDVDDVGALAMLHTLADRGETSLLAVMVCAKNRYSAACADRINTWYGRADLLVGQLKGEGVYRDSSYAEQVAAEFPGRLASGDEAPDALALYRRLLAGQPDASVVILSIGYLTNLRNLLETDADEHSQLDGVELVRRKVKLWVCMGGQFPSGREANIRWDTAASVQTLRRWPTPIVFSGWELGAQVKTASRLRALPPTSPLRRAYELFNGLEAHASWDQVAALYAVRGLDGGPAVDYWTLSPPGWIRVDAKDGSNTWQADDAGAHRHKLARRAPQLIAREIDELMMHPPLGADTA